MIPTLLDGFEGLKISVEEVNADVMETAKEIELDVEPEDVIELLQSHDKTLMNEELLLMKGHDIFILIPKINFKAKSIIRN